MSKPVILLLRWVHGLAISLWLGGVIAIGALVAPTAFRVISHFDALAGQTEVQKTLAGAVVGGSLRLFNPLSELCGVLLIVTSVLLLRSVQPSRVTRIVGIASVALSVILMVSAIYLGQVLFPALDAAQAQHNMARFDTLHHLYERLSVYQFPVLLALSALQTLRDRNS